MRMDHGVHIDACNIWHVAPEWSSEAEVQVLQEDKGNVKALFRRGKAHSGLGHTDEALRDLHAAAKLAPADKAISREIQAVKAAVRRDREVSTSPHAKPCIGVHLVAHVRP